MKKNDLISVVVPVYNVEHYLEECINSLLIQSYSNFELILVDDGSTDNSGMICDKYSKKYKNIKVIHKKNGGLSSARNVGIDNAKGKYICFIDSDDIIDSKYLYTLYNNLKMTDSDISICDFQNIVTKNDIKNIKKNNIFVYSREDILKRLYHKEYNLKIVISWNKLYKKDIFNNVRFKEGKIHEDEFIIHYLMDKADKVVITDAKLYYYRIREGSITNSYNVKRLDGIEALEDRANFYLNKNNVELYYNTMKYLLLVICKNLKKMKSNKLLKNKKNELKGKAKDIIFLLMYKSNLKVSEKVIVILKFVKNILF